MTVNLYNLRNFDEYFIPRVDNESLRRFLFFDLPTCWNSLALNNPEISSITNKLSFKSTIKNHFCQRVKILFATNCFVGSSLVDRYF